MSDDIPMDVQNQTPDTASRPFGTEVFSKMQASKPEDSMQPEISNNQHLYAGHHGQGSPTLQELEAEAAKLKDLDSQLDKLQPEQLQAPEVAEVDKRSIYVGNVDYGTTPVELQQHFSESGDVERVTILTNKATGQPKGFAYLEFALVEGANKAVATQDGSTFRNRELKVSLKRTNLPGVGRGGLRGRGRGRGMMRGRGRAGFRGRGTFRGGARFAPY